MTRLRCLGLLASSLYLAAQSNPADRPGNQTDGAYLLPSGWRVRPAGTQMPLGSFPMSTALSPTGGLRSVRTSRVCVSMAFRSLVEALSILADHVPLIAEIGDESAPAVVATSIGAPPLRALYR